MEIKIQSIQNLKGSEESTKRAVKRELLSLNYAYQVVIKFRETKNAQLKGARKRRDDSLELRIRSSLQ